MGLGNFWNMENPLLQKYNVPGPRYTSYPTVPFWENETFSTKTWKDSLIHTFWTSGKEISLYLHLPFCESLCTYCGCNTRITKNHGVEKRYIEAVLKEWELYLSIFPALPIIKELHLGGGTPTFFSPENLKLLIEGILSKGIVPEAHEYAFEGHPNNTSREHLQTLYDLGFRRVSFGIQDFDKQVQKLINRAQSFEKVATVTLMAREIGYTSINFDLIYGLPGQSALSVIETIDKTLLIQPDRIAFYSYAHIPHLKPAQRVFEHLLPNDEQKRALYEIGKKKLTAAGYSDIGMDHFALDGDALLSAQKLGTLHRNFMGYSTQQTELVVGLGVSAIGDSWTSFAQNVKSIEAYYERLDEGQLPILKGHHLTVQDVIVRTKILDLICRYRTTWTEEELYTFGFDLNFELLEVLKLDGLIEWSDYGVQVTERGRPYIRNICMAFDIRMNQNKEQKVVFSRTV